MQLRRPLFWDKSIPTKVIEFRFFFLRHQMSLTQKCLAKYPHSYSIDYRFSISPLGLQIIFIRSWFNDFCKCIFIDIILNISCIARLPNGKKGQRPKTTNKFQDGMFGEYAFRLAIYRVCGEGANPIYIRNVQSSKFEFGWRCL